MELNKTYNVNIISMNESNGYLIIIEQFNSDATQYFQNYYKQLLCYNKCSRWFGKLEYPYIEVGNVIIVQVKEAKNLWARAVISKTFINDLLPEIYLLDSQRFCDNNGRLEMRICPAKFLNLKLPTYYVDANICLDEDHVKIAMEKLIWRNQCGELSFCFTPKSINNNIYSGELIINNKADHSIIPLKKFLKHFQKKKYFPDVSKDEQCTNTIFNPMKLKNLENIFIPSGLNSVNFVNVSESEIKKDNTDGQVIEMDVKKEDNFVKALMKKRYILSKMSTSNGYKEPSDSTMMPEVLEVSKVPSIIETKHQPINSLADDSNVWWSSSSDDEK